MSCHALEEEEEEEEEEELPSSRGAASRGRRRTTWARGRVGVLQVRLQPLEVLLQARCRCLKLVSCSTKRDLIGAKMT